jgi:outer membrane biosynthesis protein TonB
MPTRAQGILLNCPRPLFTEEARKNKIQGLVRVKVLVDSTGTVKDGRPVSYWLSVEVEFNLR